MAWAPDYCTVAELKSFVKIDDTDDDVELGFAITAASRAVDTHCNRQFGLIAAPALFAYVAWPDLERGRWVVDIDDLMTVTGLVVEVPTVGVTTAFAKEPANAAAKGEPWTRLVFDKDAAVTPTLANDYAVNVTGRFGWSAVPVPVKEATMLQASRLFSRRTSPYGVAGSPDQGSELRLLARLDPDVAVSLNGPLVRPRGTG
jgi:hypothetical protein